MGPERAGGVGSDSSKPSLPTSLKLIVSASLLELPAVPEEALSLSSGKPSC